MYCRMQENPSGRINLFKMLRDCESLRSKACFVSFYCFVAAIEAIFDDAKVSDLFRVRAAAANFLARFPEH
jgi:hypothetical protein